MRRAALCEWPPPRHSGPRHCISQGSGGSGHAVRIVWARRMTSAGAAGDGTPDACLHAQMAPKLIRLAPLDAPRRVTVSWPAGLALVVAIAFALFFWGWTRGSDARVIARLPAEERARLFRLTRSKAEAVCAEPGLEDRCREEVELLSEFPECSADCRAFVARHRPRASR